MHRLIKLATILPIILTMVGVAVPANADPTKIPPQNTPIQLINRQTWRCATVAGGSDIDNNVPLVQYACDSHPSRRWIITTWDHATRAMRIRNVQTGKCMTPAGGGTSNNVPLVQYTCDTLAARMWYFEHDSVYDSWRLRNLWSHKCATVAGGSSSANNVPLVQYDCDAHPSRFWYVSK